MRLDEFFDAVNEFMDEVEKQQNRQQSDDEEQDEERSGQVSNPFLEAFEEFFDELEEQMGEVDDADYDRPEDNPFGGSPFGGDGPLGSDSPFGGFGQERQERQERQEQSESQSQQAPVDTRTENENVVVTVDLPGFSEDHLSVQVDGERLRIRAEATDEMHRESVERSVELPVPVEKSGSSARFDNGVLVVTLPQQGEDDSGSGIEIQ